MADDYVNEFYENLHQETLRIIMETLNINKNWLLAVMNKQWIRWDDQRMRDIMDNGYKIIANNHPTESQLIMITGIEKIKNETQ
jgi:hypothetical protein